MHKQETLENFVIQNVDVAVIHENGKGDKLIVSIYFENDLETKDVEKEQLGINNVAYFSPFAYQRELHIHVLQDPLTSLLETSVKVDFVVFMHNGY